MKSFVWMVAIMFLLASCATPPTAIPPGAPSPARTATPAPTPKIVPIFTTTEQAVAAAQQKFPDLIGIKPSLPGTIGASTNITTQEQPDGWNLIFWKGSGDCMAGCINHHYWYVAAKYYGTLTLVGEYVREYDAGANAFKTSGQPLWGVPK